ncbi:Protein of unknown function [Pyronema omphalodes CBS 100304]|uniref:Uncharacterized protein n=1 Tax=Pyronema omphalodes (strain CBS 100304) TaxID=1076935 RepID=U4KZ88_PYROM|nr:Protein of unknown function [Pyronema omphalodes CBS 100304]
MEAWGLVAFVGLMLIAFQKSRQPLVSNVVADVVELSHKLELPASAESTLRIVTVTYPSSVYSTYSKFPSPGLDL